MIFFIVRNSYEIFIKFKRPKWQERQDVGRKQEIQEN